MIDRLTTLARARPGAVAVADERQEWTFEALSARVNEWHRFFEAAAAQRVRTVALIMHNGPELTACVLGSWGAPVVIALLPANATAWEIGRYCSAVAFDGAIVSHPEQLEAFRASAPDARMTLII